MDASGLSQVESEEAESGRGLLLVEACADRWGHGPRDPYTKTVWAEIGRAVTNFQGPIVFVVISRYHGGAFVVFSKRLNAGLEIAAIEGSYASVIGGAPAAATVFAREVTTRSDKDPRVARIREAMSVTSGGELAALRVQLSCVMDEVRSEKLREVADEFDAIHTIERALSVGSVDRIIPAAGLRPYIVDALERGMARTLEPMT